MSVHHLTPQVRLLFRPLPPSCQPAWVVRHRGITVIALDRRASRWDTSLRLVGLLTDSEKNVIRAAYGVPEVGTPCPDDWLADEPWGDAAVPAALRPAIPGEPLRHLA